MGRGDFFTHHSWLLHPPLLAMCWKRNTISKWKNIFGPITAATVLEISLKAHLIVLKTKKVLSLKSFQRSGITSIGPWKDTHRYPFSFTQVLERRLFRENNNEIFSHSTNCSFNYSVWLQLNELVLSGFCSFCEWWHIKRHIYINMALYCIVFFVFICGSGRFQIAISLFSPSG